MTCGSAHKMWSVILNRFDQDTEEYRCKLLEDFFNFKYERGDDIMTHVSKIENLYTNLSAVNGKISEEMLQTKIISTLPPSLSIVSTSWDSTDKNKKTLTNLKSRLLIEELRRKGNNKEEPVAYNTYEGSSSSSKNKSDRSCVFCKKSNLITVERRKIKIKMGKNQTK
nr:PREDICTED: uncharacterized protein LOC109032382 [Bemisia tabaci]